MPAAHDQPRTPCRTGLRALHRQEGGYTLSEIIVGLIIVGIMLGVGILALHNFTRERPNPQVATSASIVWRGVQAYRIDHGGTLPPLSMLQHPDTFRNAFGTAGAGNGVGTQSRYVRHWPDRPNGDGGPLQVTGGTTATPPATAAPFSVLYATSPTGGTGWLAAYDGSGQRVFQRGVWNHGGGGSPLPVFTDGAAVPPAG